MKLPCPALGIALLCLLAIPARAQEQAPSARTTAENAAVTGSVKYTDGDYDGAIAEFDKAIAADPGFTVAWFSRGLAKKEKGDFAGAVADYTKAIELDPQNPGYFLLRGKTKLLMGDAAGAVGDDTQAILVKPKEAHAYICRGDAETILGKWNEAVGDYRKGCDLGDMQDYAQLMLWHAQVQAGQQKKGESDLLDYVGRRPQIIGADWFQSAASYLMGKIVLAELFNTATSIHDQKVIAKQMCRSWFVVGLKELAGGNKKGAVEYFQKAVATNQRSLDEYLMAQMQLKAIGE